MTDIAPIPRRYLKPDEAAAYLGVEPEAVRLLPDLAQCRPTPRLILYDIQDLKAYRNRIPIPQDAGALAKLITGRISEHPTTGLIYFMQCREIVKIGYSAEPPSRHAQLQAVIPFELLLLGSVPGSVAAERNLHAALDSVRYRGLAEWFYHSPALLEAIDMVAGDGHD